MTNLSGWQSGLYYSGLPTFIYAYVDSDDRVIYVGKTFDPGTRNGAHRQRSSWWTPDLTFAVICECLWPDCAKRCERRAIEDHQPVANVHHNRAVA